MSTDPTGPASSTPTPPPTPPPTRHSNVPALTIAHATKIYKARGQGRRATVTAVDDVSFVIDPGAAIGLVGASGSGKSTMARLLLEAGVCVRVGSAVTGASLLHAPSTRIGATATVAPSRRRRFFRAMRVLAGSCFSVVISGPA